MKLGHTLASIRNVVIAGAISLISISAYAMDPQQAAYRADELQTIAADLSYRAQSECGCTNTARVLGEIATLAVDVEMEARFGTEASASNALKKVVRKVKELKQYVQHIQDLNLKLEIKKELGLAVNYLGIEVKGYNWLPIPVGAPAYGTPEQDLFDRIADGAEG